MLKDARKRIQKPSTFLSTKKVERALKQSSNPFKLFRHIFTSFQNVSIYLIGGGKWFQHFDKFKVLFRSGL